MMIVLREWLKNTYDMQDGFPVVRPRIVCKDGFSMSVQANCYTYSQPRKNLESGWYVSVEIGYPSAVEDLIVEYAEDEDYTNTVYPYVPVEVVEKVINKHGGMKGETSDDED